MFATFGLNSLSDVSARYIKPKLGSEILTMSCSVSRYGLSTIIISARLRAILTSRLNFSVYSDESPLMSGDFP